MAQRANLDIEVVFFQRGFGDEFVAARAGNVDFVVIRMDILFHFVSFRLSGHRGCTYASDKGRILAVFFCSVKRILPDRGWPVLLLCPRNDDWDNKELNYLSYCLFR